MPSTRQPSKEHRDTRDRRGTPETNRPTRRPADELTTVEAAETAIGHVVNLTAKRILGATAVEPTEDGWRVEVEVIEDSRIPSTSDLLALYEVELDMAGDLLAYHRTCRYLRGRNVTRTPS